MRRAEHIQNRDKGTGLKGSQGVHAAAIAFLPSYGLRACDALIGGVFARQGGRP